MPKRFINPEGLSKPRGYTHVVSARGTLVAIAGQVAWDAAGNLVGAGDLRAQAEQVFRNLQCALEAAGARWQDLVKITVYVVGYRPEHREIVREVRSRFVGTDTAPASTLVGVQALVLPELLIEIDALAVID